MDLLCVPTIPTFYSLADLQADPVGPNSRLGTYTNFVNLMDMCGIAVPVGPRSDGRPGSVTLLAKAGRDALTASVAAVMQMGTLGATGVVLPAVAAPSAAPMPGNRAGPRRRPHGGPAAQRPDHGTRRAVP